MSIQRLARCGIVCFRVRADGWAQVQRSENNVEAEVSTIYQMMGKENGEIDRSIDKIKYVHTVPTWCLSIQASIQDPHLCDPLRREVIHLSNVIMMNDVFRYDRIISCWESRKDMRRIDFTVALFELG